MKLKNHVSNSNRNEDPLRNEKSLKDKALMTGQQKAKKICTLQTHFTLNKKEKKKGTLMRKTGSNNHQRGQKASKKITSIRRPHSWIKEDVKIRQMTCHNPFKKKNTQRKEEKPLRIHYRHFKMDH